jgi:hypothetical protein
VLRHFCLGLACALGAGLFMPATAGAQCPEGQLDYDYWLGSLQQALDELLVDDEGNSVWSGGDNPIYLEIPQVSPSFYGVDNSGSGIPETDQFALLAAVIDGDIDAHLSGIDPVDAAAIRAAFAANVAAMTTREITLQNVFARISGVLGVTITMNSKNFVTGATNVINQSDVSCSGFLCFGIGVLFPLDLDIPSLWTQGEEPGLLAEADPEIERLLINLGAAIMTIGDPVTIEWFQNVVGQLTKTIIQILVPALLDDLKVLEDFDKAVDCDGFTLLEVTINNLEVSDGITADEVLIRMTA